jgi:competence protein ComEC
MGVVFCALKGHVRGALFVIITVLVLGYLPLSRGSLRMTMLDVGHGDAATLRFPEGGKMLVDTGGGRHDASNRAAAYRQITPALARQQMTDLDVLVITHSDLDHVGAAGRLLDRIRVDELWLAPCGHDVRALKSLIAQAIGSETRVRLLHAGESFHWQGVTVSPLWPPVHHRLADGSCLHGANGSSLVLHLGYAGRSIVLAADIGMAQERAIMRHFPGLSADVLKVAHHGSKSSTSSSWIESLSPRFALISGPFKGGRMPPHASTAERLIRQGVWTFITGRDGAIDVEISETGRLDVRPHLSRLTERLRPP